MSPIQLVVFDMAGTTVRDDNEVFDCFMQATENSGLQADAGKLNPMMGWAKKLVFQTLWAEQIGKNNPDFESKVEVSYTKFKQVLEDRYRTQPVQPTEGCLDLFAWLKSQNIKIALNTGFYRQVTDIILQRLSWDQGLDNDYVGSSESIIQASITPSEIYNNEGRPAPYMIQKAMYELDVKDPQKVIVVGDTPSDIQAGVNANSGWSLGVTNGTHTKEQLKTSPHNGLLNSLADLKPLIASL